ncbi:MAG TPA: 4-hydroxythreonine-4-phosphate dehydrogenase PdxA, partial [Opitutaceae bacterium]|nr:4-hydroxythreonine-4-phosphate dehydrogenase PdxA [Opitutaceae bacterium]
MAAPAPIAITCGDPAGIGPEIVAAWAAAHPEAAEGAALIGPARWLRAAAGAGGERAGEGTAGLEAQRFAAAIPVGLEDYQAVPGKPDAESSLVAWAAMEVAAEGCRAGRFSAVVTGPVSKERMNAIGWNYPGQTEFFADKWGRRSDATMAFCGGTLRMALLTWHIPLREVPGQLAAASFERAVKACEELARAAGTPPGQPVRIAVCGLNPHAGEGGLLGTEERDVIDPILDRLRARFPGLSRTLAADTVFGRQLKGEFDVSLALYHDQGLAPLKTIDFDEAVNVTLGLRHVRTSPDHGTAFGIAG